MQKDIVMVGTGDFADWIADFIENDMNRTIRAYVVDRKYLDNDEYNGKPVYAFEDVNEIFNKDEVSFVIGFVGQKMYKYRLEKYNLLVELGYELENIIHSTAVISPKAKMGNGNIILPFVSISKGVEIGNCNVFCSQVSLSHDVVVGHANYIASGFSAAGFSEIRNNCFCGVNSSVNNGTVLANYTFVGAGIFISKDTNEYDVFTPEKHEPLKRIKSTSLRIFLSRRK
ncbi:LbetaH domain-containing protein [Agathobacter ruminis]|uniref:PglD N-terminal domain-containing protein n=1 Tax=Agathobacter ruminis TaxID=1712665 RepID=A0A2G3E4X4_9FIRM|nr:hypothetical protein [Agathobacter ruminis]MDC7302046.1 hypothetical protein [Agathobacter ruminis]PHU38210.1 hypothetical protein CSX02_04155 [Agathobacter ruminis]